MRPLLNGAENTVTKERENAEVLMPSLLWTLVARLAFGNLRFPEISRKVRSKQDLLLIQKY